MSHTTASGRRRAAVAVAGALLAAAPAAQGAAPWSDPQLVPGGHFAAWQPLSAAPVTGYRLEIPGALLGFTPGGTGLAVLGRDAGGQGLTTFDGAAGAFGAVRASTFGGVAPALMAPYGRASVIVAGAATAKGDPRAPANPSIPLDAAASRGTVTGGFATRQVLAHGLAADRVAAATVTALAANPAGDAAAVVAVPVLGRTRLAGFQSKLFVRRRGQSTFRKVADLGPRTVGRSPAALAVNGPGDVLAAWDDRRSVRARMVTAAGTLRDEQRLGPGGSAWVDGSRMAASMDATRRMLVAWTAQRVGEGNYAGSPGIVAVAYAPAAKPFGAAQVVQRGLPKGANRGIGAPGVQATLLRTGGLVTWTGFSAGHFAVRAADVGAGKASAVADLSAPGADARLQGLAVGPRGGLVAAWSTAAGVFAAARAAGSTAWGAPETVSTTSPDAFLGQGVRVAADPVGGRAVALWSDPPATPVPAPAPVAARSSVRASG